MREEARPLPRPPRFQGLDQAQLPNRHSQGLHLAINCVSANHLRVSLCNGGLDRDRTRMKGVRAAPVTRTVRAAGGGNWGGTTLSVDEKNAHLVVQYNCGPDCTKDRVRYIQIVSWWMDGGENKSAMAKTTGKSFKFDGSFEIDDPGADSKLGGEQDLPFGWNASDDPDAPVRVKGTWDGQRFEQSYELCAVCLPKGAKKAKTDRIDAREIRVWLLEDHAPVGTGQAAREHVVVKFYDDVTATFYAPLGSELLPGGERTGLAEEWKLGTDYLGLRIIPSQEKDGRMVQFSGTLSF